MPTLWIPFRCSKRVVGITFVTADTAASAGSGQVFPSADGVVEFWLEGGAAPQNHRATPKAGEARFSEYEFPNTDAAASDGGIAGRGTLEEVAGSPIIYHGRRPSGSTARVWRFDPVANTHSAITATTSLNSVSDVSAREHSPYGWLLGINAFGDYVARTWTRASEGTGNTLSTWVVFSGGEAPENVDVEDAAIVWASGGDGAGGPYTVRIDELGNEITWAMPTITGYSWAYIDTIQSVGNGEALGVAQNTSSTGDDDFLSIFSFHVAETEATDISDGVTVDGDPYRTWASANADNIAVQQGVKMAVRSEQVVAHTDDGTILLGTLIRECL